MAVVPRTRKGGKIVYYVANKVSGRLVWERVGAEKREAERRDLAMRREIKAGTYEQRRTGTSTVNGFARAWFDKRAVRTAENEAALWQNHVVARCSWFLKMKLEDVRASHVNRLVDDLGKSWTDDDGKARQLAPKSVKLIYGVLRTMIRDARIADIISTDPCILPRGKFKKATPTERATYTTEEIVRIVTCPEVPPDARTWIAMAFCTGMRQGELCGRRWQDWDREAKPLGCLTVSSQYNGEPIKTDRTRKVPVHPTLARALEWWWVSGFELVYRRKPRADDAIVPHADGMIPHTKSSSYKLWRRALTVADVTSRSLHSARHTMITMCRRGGARKDVLEKVTHNATGDIVDQYTHWDWAPLCEAVSCLRIEFDTGLDKT